MASDTAFSGFPESTIQFLAELSRNNERTWFEEHREACERLVIEPAKAFVEALGGRLKSLDPKIQAVPRVRGSIKAMELRRRFPNSKRPPYKDHLDLIFWSGQRRAWDNSGFFLRLTPDRLILAGGMVEFQKETLARYRDHVLDDVRGPELEAIVRDLRADGYVIAGESYKRIPAGIPTDHPRAALLKHGAVFATLTVEHPTELGTPSFVDFAFLHFQCMAPLHAWLVALKARAPRTRVGGEAARRARGSS
jgi:uncharacterized protein (TIGR02453 family)